MLPNDQFDVDRWAEMLEWGESDGEFDELIQQFKTARDEAPRLTRAQRYEIWDRVWHESEAEPVISLSTINYLTAGWATAVVATMILIAFLTPAMGFRGTETAESGDRISAVETVLEVIPDLDPLSIDSIESLDSSSLEATQIARWSFTSCVYSPAYWRYNPAEWPVDTLVLGGESLTQVELMIILQEPVLGDLTYLLAQQLIAAEFNLAQSGDALITMPAVDDAQKWLVDNPIGSTPSAMAREEAMTLIQALDTFNTAETEGLRCAD